MRHIKRILYLLFAVVALASCDTYGDYEQDFSPVYPLSGQYIVTVSGADGVALGEAYLYLYNTTSNDTDKLWIKMGSKNNAWGILGKINCNVDQLEFSGEASNLAVSTDGATSATTFIVTLGKLILKGAITPTGGKSDAIDVSFTVGGQNYKAAGFRFTGWNEDEQ